MSVVNDRLGLLVEAAEAVSEPELRDVILSFGQALASAAVADDTAAGRQDAVTANGQITLG